MGGLGEGQAEPLAQEQEAIDEPAGELDVVVDDEQPVVTGGRVLGEQRVEALELAAAERRDGVQLDLVARRQELGCRRTRRSSS